MRTIIFSTAIRLLTPVFLLFSVYILFRGHNHPGGGFIGGLIGAIAFVFHVLAHGANATFRVFFSLTFYFYTRRAAGHSRTRYALQILNANVRNRKSKEQPHRWNFVIWRVRPVYLMGLGMLLAVTSGTMSLALQKPFMTGLWMEHKLPVLGALGTPLLFDAGVYLLVMGMVLKLVFTMSKE